MMLMIGKEEQKKNRRPEWAHWALELKAASSNTQFTRPYKEGRTPNKLELENSHPNPKQQHRLASTSRNSSYRSGSNGSGAIPEGSSYI